eukprot:comp12046_c0_seq1/m.6750 comp12046_c0_seq1/g.6750  ORF comp12046_c0_seq1/g.6750 comp12046_c0_seq1/m.6750 type:complete len:862 (-) comp12046_c0_seq1:775-3360(-)
MAERVVLPTNVRPVHYDLTLTPDLTNFVYSGFETVTLEVKTKSVDITLNIKELNVTKATLTLEDGSTMEASIHPDLAEEVCRFSFPTPFEPQTARLYVEFDGVLNDLMAGFYRSSYVKQDGSRSWMATTQFEPTDARRAFPCWDEPALKSTFSVSMRVPNDLTALGNMDIIKETQMDGGMKEVTFDKTPIMSTYLVAFICGEFEYVEGTTREGVRVRTYTPVGHKEQGRFSVEVACETLSFFSEYFDIPYPLPKLDQVAIPDFSAGAMENWGLVTYRTVVLLFDPASTPASYKQRIAYIVGHELAHQWFGNLVTMEWWTHLWLNEGFATWVGWLAVDHIFPDWKVWNQFMLNELKRAMELDALKSSHPIEVEVTHARQVDEIFDAISYAKGASVIRMLATYLGEGVFRDGLRQYLKKFAYKNALTEDLWEALQNASGKDVRGMMETWTKQTGYPVVTISESSGCLHCRQHRFFSAGKTEDNTQWVVPLRLFDSDKKPSDDILVETEGLMPMPKNSNEWFKANYHQAGIFRVQYADSLLPKLGKAIESKQLDVTDRVGILSDAFSLAQSGYGSTTQALALIGYYHNEDDYTVWSDICALMGKVRSVWYTEDQDTLERMRALQRRLMRPITRSLGWSVRDSDSHLTHMLRALVISGSGAVHDPEIIEEAKRKYKQFMSGDHQHGLHPDLRAPVFNIALMNCETNEVFDELVALYLETEAEDLKTIVLRVLGSGPSRELVIKALDFALSEQVRNQDVSMVLLSCAQNPKGRDATWEYFMEHYQVFYDKFASGNLLMARIISYAADSLATEERAREVEEFFAKHPLRTVERTIHQVAETIRANAAWRERDRAVVAAWLKANVELH